MPITCRIDEGGKPLCRLGAQVDKCGVEIRGKSLSSITTSRNRNWSYAEEDALKKEYDLFVVMEAPNFYENQRGGLGFGDEYRDLLFFVEKSGFDPERVFVSCLTKCHPPKRKPTVQEIKSCLPHIHREIELTSPKVIMTLGTGPLRLFSMHNKGGITNLHGKVFKKPLMHSDNNTEYLVVPSFDLNYFKFSTDPKVKRRTIGDYKNAFNACFFGADATPQKYQAKFDVLRSISDVKKFVNAVKERKFFAFDTESRALPWNKEPLICFSFCWGFKEEETTCAILPIYTHDPEGLDWKLHPFWSPSDYKKIVSLLKSVFENSKIAKAAHNAKYDVNAVRKHLGIKITGFIYDSMLMHHALNEQKPHSLEFLADIEFGVGDYSSELKEITGIGKVLNNTYDHIPDKLLWPYAATDAECCWRLAKLYYKELRKKPHLWDLYCKEIEPLTRTLTDAEWYGHKIDRDVLVSLISEYTTEKKNLLNDMQSLTWQGFNPMSAVHVREALIQLGFREAILDSSKVQGYNTSKDVLLKIKEECPFAGQILKYRNIIKILRTYLENTLEDLDDHDRIRHSFLIHGTESARLSCKLFHQIPKSDQERTDEGKYNLRQMFVAGAESSLVYFDYSQIELRVLAILAKDKEMQRLFDEEGEDIHRTTAALILGIPEEEVSDFNRQLGKALNFLLAYGGEGFKLIQTGSWKDKNGIERPITWDMFNLGMERFKTRFQALTTYLETVPTIARSNGGIFVTPFGRERRMGSKLSGSDRYVVKAAEREIVNFSIQSTAAAITIRTLNIIHEWKLQWVERGIIDESDLYLVNTIHDSGIYEVKSPFVDNFVTSLRRAAERSIPELDNKSFPCAIGVGKSWEEAEKNSKKG